MVKEDILDSFKSALDKLYKGGHPTRNVGSIILERFSDHYYIPIAYTNDESAKELVKHIITVDSEIVFLDALKDKMDCLSQKCEYWFFSKLDETTDKDIYIPYIDKSGKLRKFIPDFIFWFKFRNSNKYIIYFIDPKSTAYTDYELKVDGYERIFTDKGQPKEFDYRDYKVEVRLKFIGNPNQVGDKYKSYWVDNSQLFDDICNGTP
jgi:hypothetical protein